MNYFLILKMIKTMAKAIEMVVYKVKTEKVNDKILLVETVNNIIKNFDGFISRTVHQDEKDPAIFMDYVTWESLEQAHTAMKTMEQTPEIMPFMQAIERVEVMKHFEVV